MSINLESIRTGLTGSTEIMVGTRDTAPHVGSGRIKVLATPVLVMPLEESALNAVEGLLPEGHQTVGTRLDARRHACSRSRRSDQGRGSQADLPDLGGRCNRAYRRGHS